jgi:tripartite-type tricarboxylate transporter receptor subunit TctC
MKFLHRRQFVHLAAGASSLSILPARTARAQSYPTRPVRIIVGFPAGGPTDICARLIGQWLSDRLGQQFVVENRPGAATNLATEAVVRAPADGYTLLMIVPPATINATLYPNLNFNFIRDIVPIASIMREPDVLVINPSLPANTLPDFIAYAKANPGKINMASAGIGSFGHMAGELFKAMAGVDMVHVPYRGNPRPDLIAGQVQVFFDAMSTSLELIRTERLRALGVTGAKRSEVLPDIPTVGDFVPGYEASTWYGIGAPKNTASEIVEKLNKQINIALSDPKMKARLADLGGSVLPGSSADFGKFVADDTEKWGKVIRTAHIRAE